MPEERSARSVTEWTRAAGCSYEACLQCAKDKKTSYGVMMTRFVTERNNEAHREYKILCKTCGQTTDTHRSRLVTEKEWAGKQEPR